MNKHEVEAELDLVNKKYELLKGVFTKIYDEFINSDTFQEYMKLEEEWKTTETYKEYKGEGNILTCITPSDFALWKKLDTQREELDATEEYHKYDVKTKILKTYVGISLGSTLPKEWFTNEYINRYT